MNHGNMLEYLAYNDLVNNTEHEPITPKSTTYQKGSSKDLIKA